MIALLLASSLTFGAEVPSLDTKEQGRLESGELVLRHTRYPGDAAAGRLLGLMEIEAGEDRVWEVVLDYEGRAATSGAQVSRYRDEWSGGAHLVDLAYELPVFTRTVRYHLQHRYEPQDDLLQWSLDPQRVNDMVLLEGSFSTAAGSRPGTTLLVFESGVDTGRPIPDWVEQFLLKRTLTDFLEGIRDRAQESHA